MYMDNPKTLSRELRSLVIFRNLLQNKVVFNACALLGGGQTEEQALSAYAELVSALYCRTDNLSDYVLNSVLEDENFYVHKACADALSESYQAALNLELHTLQQLADLTGAEMRQILHTDIPLPEWQNRKTDLAAAYAKKLAEIRTEGYGIWAKYHVFAVKGTEIVPVKYPDPQRLSDFSGYARERSQVIENTKALLAGEPCNNVLLYGDAGAGKSSTVKAIANEFKDEGLRLIEVKKNQLYALPEVMERISGNPLKFILFIDDLSFSRNDADFGALKAILEGSVSGRSRNVAIYATSNRRHLVKESVSDRDGDDLHLQDTIQELTSLSARFGLQITFSRPDKSLYGSIVLDLARQNGIDMPEEELLRKAEAHALRSGGRSPRTAKQFVDYLAYAGKHKE